jgi:DNA replication protein DnaC
VPLRRKRAIHSPAHATHSLCPSTRARHLLIDDFGLAPLTETEKQDLLETIEERDGVSSTIVTSQLPIGDWHEYLGGARLADAILDRLIHTAHRIELTGQESMRKEHTNLLHGGHSDK